MRMPAGIRWYILSGEPASFLKHCLEFALPSASACKVVLLFFSVAVGIEIELFISAFLVLFYFTLYKFVLTFEYRDEILINVPIQMKITEL